MPIKWSGATAAATDPPNKLPPEHPRITDIPRHPCHVPHLCYQNAPLRSASGEKGERRLMSVRLQSLLAPSFATEVRERRGEAVVVLPC